MPTDAPGQVAPVVDTHATLSAVPVLEPATVAVTITFMATVPVADDTGGALNEADTTLGIVEHADGVPTNSAE